MAEAYCLPSKKAHFVRMQIRLGHAWLVPCNLERSPYLFPNSSNAELKKVEKTPVLSNIVPVGVEGSTMY
jgi:hypothetical protein